MIEGRILIVEDDPELRQALADTLLLEGLDVREAGHGEAALAKLAEGPVDMVISDVNMPGMDGEELLLRLRALYPQIPVLLITAYASVTNAVEAMKNGAVDYLVKPFQPEQLMALIRRTLGTCTPVDQDAPIAEEGSSQRLLQLARRVAGCDSTVLISGESGTGKEVLARYIHTHSPRQAAPFVALNCAAIPENMLEAILFGHEKGAFTGAYASAPGKFEQANGGTILLDEISEMDLGLQAKLLRVLQEREVERVGGRKTISLDVRVLATTNRDLLAEVRAGRFREDLYYRLSVFPLQWLPLRQRPADILPLARHLLAHHGRKMQLAEVCFSSEAEAALLAHPWPGNVRELDNVIQRALILQIDGQVRADDLMLDPLAELQPVNNMTLAVGPVSVPEPLEKDADLGADVRQHEYQLILDALRQFQGRRKEAAEKLGISPRTLRYKLAQMRDSGMDVDNLLKIA